MVSIAHMWLHSVDIIVPCVVPAVCRAGAAVWCAPSVGNLALYSGGEHGGPSFIRELCGHDLVMRGPWIYWALRWGVYRDMILVMNEGCYWPMGPVGTSHPRNIILQVQMKNPISSSDDIKWRFFSINMGISWALPSDWLGYSIINHSVYQ